MCVAIIMVYFIDQSDDKESINNDIFTILLIIISCFNFLMVFI